VEVEEVVEVVVGLFHLYLYLEVVEVGFGDCGFVHQYLQRFPFSSGRTFEFLNLPS